MVKAIAAQLKKKDIEPDLVDLHALVDSSLSLKENYNIVLQDYGLLSNKRDINLGTKSVNKVDRLLKAKNKFEQLSIKRQKQDARTRARTVYEANELNKKNYTRWKRNINRYDIEGVDSIGGYSKSVRRKKKVIKKKKKVVKKKKRKVNNLLKKKSLVKRKKKRNITKKKKIARRIIKKKKR